MVLIGSNSSKFSLGKYKCLEVLSARDIFSLGVDVHDVEPRLVAVHRVQDDLNVVSVIS